jgi:uncharacterized protein with GYD domain
MPIYIFQGRYTREALEGLVARPEDRAAASARLLEAAGGKLLSFYLTLGEYDFMITAELPDIEAATAVSLVGAVDGTSENVRTIAAMTTAQARDAFATAGKLKGAFRPAGSA